ncbi:type III PLP-dependent enzyme [Xylanibacillus composti]|uniref:Diaminopimelate decarboxylase n=1 Tax=Xylanibacillus composti TaxID=1572762 RepID=A0A8J4H1W8_9BACL|nr:type III PLP-dependent enzyme [Xylanibacillus composti]MDT9726794.1 type III PLP-dependent enzyme [Xylanibacillus composti]GIQ67223.1 diaminopimelate decarboxylase [Xylanibacillus composti]
MEDEKLRLLSAEYGTPLYVYDGDIMERQYRRLKESLPERFEIFYSAKSNPALGVCEMFRKWGSHIEVASLGELHVAKEAGFDPWQIIFTSPGKTTNELEASIDIGIYCLNVESVEEARRIHQLALSRQKIVNIAIRVNPNFNLSMAGIRMSGVPTQFGIDQDELDEAVRQIMALSGVRLIGIHVFTGTQMLDAAHLTENMREIIKLAVSLSAAHGFPLEFLDLGGGFGIPYFKGEEALDMQRLKEGMQEVWSAYERELATTRIGVESGRYLMAEAGEFVTRVLYVKECKGVKYLVCDGGSHQHASSAFLGRYVRNNFPMRIAGKSGAQLEEVGVAGPLCTPTDMLGQRIELPAAEEGDLLVIEKSGAYGLSHSPVMFLSHALPAEIIVYQDQTYVLRERGKVEDFLLGQQSLFKSENLSHA